MRRLLSVLFWSVVSAAFLGPGTVATATTAGARHGTALLWALLFSTVACLLLQEAAARLTLVSDRDLGQALRAGFSRGAGRWIVPGIVLGGIVLGCAAYQAGNILGAVAGAKIVTGMSARWLTLGFGTAGALLLLLGAPRTVARLLSVMVAVMGAAFLWTAWHLRPATADVVAGLLRPAVPAESGLVVLGLVGTTVVPYNLFLGSGLARGQSLGEMRFGLAVAIGLGGVISMAVVVVGTAVADPWSFAELADVLTERLGGRGRWLFAAGLCAAGLSSAITAPLAAAVTARGLSSPEHAPRWDDRAWRFRAVWGSVLATGVAFGLTGVRPVPAIVLAQALNGVLLPLVAVFLLLAVNDRALVGAAALNGHRANAALGVVVAVALVLGASQVVRAGATALGLEVSSVERVSLPAGGALALLLAWPVGRAIVRRRRA